MSEKAYREIVEHYESCLEKHGDTHLGVDWPKREDVDRRYNAMLQVIRPPGREAPSPTTVLDFGCGAAHLLEFIRRREIRDVSYAGLDISEKFVSLARTKFPDHRFYCLDILDAQADLPSFDYVVMNGVFTEKRSLTFDEMLSYWKKTLRAVFARSRVGVAFNVMSKQVDWEREDLFHLPLDVMAGFVTKELSRHFVVRNDYGLYEYTTYVYREESPWQR
ncbi:MAG TPA: class I SAM-dependent methyltransferase [Polyangiaceae bacterium]|jgi:SAM-dependent methyltransferase